MADFDKNDDFMLGNDDFSDEDSALSFEDIEELLRRTEEEDLTAFPDIDINSLVPDDIEKLVSEGEAKKDKAPDDSGDSFLEMPLPEEEMGALLNSLDGEQDIYDDFGDDISEEKLIKLQDMFKMLDNAEEIDAKTQVVSDLIRDEKNLDTEIEEALKKDFEESVKVQKDEDISFIEDVSVYDADRGDDIEIPIRINKEKFSIKKIINKIKVSRPLQVILGAVMSVLVFAGSYVGALNYDFVPPNTVLIEIPSYYSNSANSIYVNQKAVFKDNILAIERLQISPSSTNFYFTDFVDVSSYNINIIDNKNKTYFLNLEHFKDMKDKENKVISMEPLDGGVKTFSLVIRDPASEEAVVYNYKFDKPFEHLPTRYLTKPISSANKDSKITATIEKGLFSSTDTYLEMKLSVNATGNVVRLGGNETSQLVKVTEGASSVLFDDIIYLYSDTLNEHTVYAKAKFAPVKSLGSKLDVELNNLYEVYEVNRQIPVSSLMSAYNEYNDLLMFSGYALYLERLIKAGDKFVLVLHTEDINVNVPNEIVPASSGFGNTTPRPKPTPRPLSEDEKEEYKRVETYLNAKLICREGFTNRFEIDGEVKTAKVGSDVIFDVSEYADELAQTSLNNLYIEIQDVRFKSPNIKFKIDLERLPIRPSVTLEDQKQHIKDSFESRLKYKFGLIGKNEITGFQNDLLIKQRLMKHYEPVANGAEPVYSVQIGPIEYESDKIEAIVFEIWQESEKTLSADFIKEHKITAKPLESGWIIVTDEIINTHLEN